MIKGIGTDIIEIERIKKAMENPRFLEEYFTEGERELFLKKGNRAETVAGNFAAKEAYSKAMGTGVRNFSLKDIEILRDDKGKPYIASCPSIHKKLNFHVSISHSKEYATAVIVAEKVEL